MSTASELQRHLACPPSAVLPRVRTLSHSGSPAERGTFIHAFIASAAMVGRDAALAKVPEEYYEICSFIELDKLPTDLAHEVALAYDPTTGVARILPGKDLRDYSDATPGEYVGTADVVGIGADSVYVADYKTGWTPQPPAKEHAQLRFLATAAAESYGKERATVEIIRIMPDGGAWRDTAELDAFDFLNVRTDLLWLTKRKAEIKATLDAGGIPDVITGDHCKWCPSRHSCPAHTALIRQLATGSLDIAQPLTPAVYATAYHRLKQYRELLRDVEKAVYAAAKQQPIDIGDGMMLGEIITEGNEIVDAETAMRVLSLRYGSDAAADAATYKVTKTSIDKAIKVHKQEGETLAQAKRDVFGDIRSAGGITRKPTKKIGEYPREKKK